MSTNKTMRDLIDGLIACDDQPREERLTEMRKSLQHKVTDMKTKGQFAQYIFGAGFVVMALGFSLILKANNDPHEVAWLSQTGFYVLVAGAIVFIVGVFARAHYLGLGYIWTRHDFHDAAIMELSVQVQKLTQRIDDMDKKNAPTP